MLLAEPQPTPADLHFSLAQVPVRVSGWFWVGAALLGWGQCRALAGGDQRELLRLLVAWVAVVLVSILVHEMGHALAWRAFGRPARIVLYHLGGLTVSQNWGRRSLSAGRQVAVSAAGPLLQLALAVAIVVVLRVGGYEAPFPIESLALRFGLYDGILIPSPLVARIVDFALFVNVFWPLLNLLPVPPLDGGQIVREGLAWAGVPSAARISLGLGALCGCAVGLWGISNDQTYLAILFFMLAASCFRGLGR
jgi:stage IV sporulation protein FB